MRLSVTLTDPQWRWLKREAQRLGLSVGELLRRLIDDVRLSGEASDSDSR